MSVGSGDTAIGDAHGAGTGQGVLHGACVGYDDGGGVSRVFGLVTSPWQADGAGCGGTPYTISTGRSSVFIASLEYPNWWGLR